MGRAKNPSSQEEGQVFPIFRRAGLGLAKTVSLFPNGRFKFWFLGSDTSTIRDHSSNQL